MRKIGLVIAVEDDALRQRFGEGRPLKDKMGAILYQTKNCQLYALRCGSDEIYAASATQYLIDRYKVAAIVNYGVVGGCTDAMRPGEPCIVTRVVHYQYDLFAVDNVPVGRYLEYPDRQMPASAAFADLASPELRRVVCASGDKFVGDSAEKAWLHNEFGADIYDMEAAAILLTCDRNSIPCLIIKTVADSFSGGAAEYWREKDRTAKSCLDYAVEIIDGL